MLHLSTIGDRSLNKDDSQVQSSADQPEKEQPLPRLKSFMNTPNPLISLTIIEKMQYTGHIQTLSHFKMTAFPGSDGDKQAPTVSW